MKPQFATFPDSNRYHRVRDEVFTYCDVRIVHPLRAELTDEPPAGDYEPCHSCAARLAAADRDAKSEG